MDEDYKEFNFFLKPGRLHPPHELATNNDVYVQVDPELFAATVLTICEKNNHISNRVGFVDPEIDPNQISDSGLLWANLKTRRHHLFGKLNKLNLSGFVINISDFRLPKDYFPYVFHIKGLAPFLLLTGGGVCSNKLELNYLLYMNASGHQAIIIMDNNETTKLNDDLKSILDLTDGPKFDIKEKDIE